MPLRERTEIVNDLINLTKEPGFIYTFAYAVRKNLFVEVDDVENINWRTRLINSEISFVGGLLVGHQLSLHHHTADVMETQLETLDKLLDELHKTYVIPIDNPSNQSDQNNNLASRPQRPITPPATGSFVAEGIFYGGDGGYDYQYLRLAHHRYKNDLLWISSNKHFDLDFATAVAVALKRIIETKGNELKLDGMKDHDEMCDRLLDSFCVDKDLVREFGTKDTTSFLETFSVIPGETNPNLQIPGQYNELDARPIIIVPDGRHFVFSSFLLCESIYLSPFYWMNKDASYINTASCNRGEATAEISADMMRRVFGNDNVYRDVNLNLRKGHTLTDADVLVVFRRRILVVQAKSKKLTELSRIGDEDRQIKDFQSAIQEAYDQARICRTTILHKDVTLEDKSGHNITLAALEYDVYLICLTSDPYPAVALQTRLFLAKSAEDPFPMVISLFDLDTITHYLDDPFELLYYIHERCRLSERIVADNEMAVLGRHFMHGLDFPDTAQLVFLEQSYAQSIDADSLRISGYKTRNRLSIMRRFRWTDSTFRQLVREISYERGAESVEISFFLFGLSDSFARELIRKILKSRSSVASLGKDHGFTMTSKDGTFGVSYLCGSSDLFTLRDRSVMLAKAEKYRTRCTSWLGLGAGSWGNRVADIVWFDSGEWFEDNQTQRLTEFVSASTRSLGGTKKPGRNDPCYCGSGRKYKRCCGKFK